MQRSHFMPMRHAADGRAEKTLDIGYNGTSLSTDLFGTILQLSSFHPKHGIVLAEPYEQFDGTRFRDTPYVREHRTRMLKSVKSGTPGFGLRFQVNARNIQVASEGIGSARISYETASGLQIVTSLSIDEDGVITQSSKIDSSVDSVICVRYTLDLCISVNRASYGQLTEGGPIPLPKSENRINLLDGGCTFVIVNPYLDAQLQGVLENNCKLIDLGKDVRIGNFECSPVTAVSSGLLEIPPKTSRTLTARFCLRQGTSPISSLNKSAVTRELPLLCSEPSSTGCYIVRRNLEYILGNCAIPLSTHENAVCLLTDHVALPLGWMRDNYWQTRFLMDVQNNIGQLTDGIISESYSELIKQTVKGHLRWIFYVAQRPYNFWHRSYLTTGQPKDGPVFQLDQQCYPLLELCDFLEAYPEEREFVDQILRENAVSDTLNLIESKKDPVTGLYPTDETPGDDAVTYPFHFSSHILLWYAISKFAKLVAGAGNVPDLWSKNLSSIADNIRITTLKYFLSLASDGKPSFAYLVNGSGVRTFYHDANDIPTLFAPSWGFTKTSIENEAWRNTMRFAFSEANEGGFYATGPFGGLGSVHTRGPWTLGYFQSWSYAQMTGDQEGEDSAWKKICGVMLWDGLFSEAVDGETGECTSKAWFSWPGSMIGSGLLHPIARERYL